MSPPDSERMHYGLAGVSALQFATLSNQFFLAYTTGGLDLRLAASFSAIALVAGAVMVWLSYRLVGSPSARDASGGESA